MKLHLFALFALTPLLPATSASAADYASTAQTLDSGGKRTSSADYSNDGSVTTIVGISSEPTSATSSRSGYIGQLYDLLGYGLLASDYYPPEGSSIQLFPVRTADDGTNVVIPTTGFSFVPLEGPIPGISATGLASTANVYQNTDAIVGASSPQFAGLITLTLHVQDTIPDNFSTYAGDGIGDDWQVQYFGIDNPLAAPGADASGTGQTNLFKYLAGLDPLDSNSVFRLRIEAVPGQPTRTRLIFGPVFAGRTYTVQAKASLLDATWLPLADEISDGLAPERSVTDRSATGAEKFYRVEITRP